jgi:hypothetical protein
MVKLQAGRIKFILEEFSIGDQGMNYTFIGHDRNKSAYTPYQYALVFLKGDEIEAVKNFLLTIRDDIPS